jgi:formylglycine-generating enzyme required for sulfatase activity
MKKTLIPLFILASVMVVFGCQKKSPTAPAPTDTPNYTETSIVLSFTPTQTLTITVTASITTTFTITQTATITQTFTTTPTVDSSALVSVPGGTFNQTDGMHSFSHTISSFMIGKYQVTYDLWSTVYQWAIANGYTFADPGIDGNSGTGGILQPVTSINWRDVIVWCNAYSEKTGLTPVYCSDAGFTAAIKNASLGGTYSGSTCTAAGCFDDPYVNWSANGYRLPTEGEYQYAASYIDGTNWMPYDHASGATADFTDEAATDLVGWDSVNSPSGTQNVGEKAPNALGIYDMSGNVYEWCFDWYGSYPTTAQTNYRGPSSGSERVIRGGSYFQVASGMRVGARNSVNPYPTFFSAGFRFARSN